MILATSTAIAFLTEGEKYYEKKLCTDNSDARDTAVDSLYNALIQDDAKTVVALLGDVDNVRAHCASYAYAWNNNRSDTCEGFLLTASDGTQFGVGLFAENGYQYIEAFVSVSDDEYGFHCIYAGDHYVEIVEGWGYNYLKGDEFF